MQRGGVLLSALPPPARMWSVCPAPTYDGANAALPAADFFAPICFTTTARLWSLRTSQAERFSRRRPWALPQRSGAACSDGRARRGRGGALRCAHDVGPDRSPTCAALDAATRTAGGASSVRRRPCAAASRVATWPPRLEPRASPVGLSPDRLFYGPLEIAVATMSQNDQMRPASCQSR